jgi:uncharacterized membrane protein
MIEWIAFAIEVVAVLVIVGAIVLAIVPDAGGAEVRATRASMFSACKRRMARGLLLGLELLLAADIVGTVAAPPTLTSLAALALLALIRSFLSWSLAVEIDGCWPWRVRTVMRTTEGDEPKTERIEVNA